MSLVVTAGAATDGTASFQLRGAIDDRADFRLVTATAASTVVIDFGGVTSVNSYGVRKWSQMVAALAGRKITYRSCPVVVVQQFNVVLSLLRGVDVESFALPLECNGCCDESERVVATKTFIEETLASRLDQYFVCGKCERKLSFLEDEEIYFRFLEPEID